MTPLQQEKIPCIYGIFLLIFSPLVDILLLYLLDVSLSSILPILPSLNEDRSDEYWFDCTTLHLMRETISELCIIYLEIYGTLVAKKFRPNILYCDHVWWYDILHGNQPTKHHLRPMVIDFIS